MDYNSKTYKVRAALERGEIITSWAAIQRWGATRLSAIIFNLRNNYSMEIASRMVYTENRERYAEYWLVMPEDITL